MTFSEAYKALNTAQKEAVDSIEGPLLVLAGPGTGKTQLLSARVAHILTKTDSNAENILCLTFTEKAANNMKQRLLDMIGPAARRVVIKTFHGLGAEIMNSNPDYFWNAARLEPAPDAVKLEIVTSILSSLPLSSPLALKFSGQYTLVDDVFKAINKAKEAGLTPEKLAAITEVNLAYLLEAQELFEALLNDRVSKKQLKEYQELLHELADQTHDVYTAPIPSIAKVLKSSLFVAVQEAAESNKMTPISHWKKQWTELMNGKRIFKDVRRNNWWLELSRVYQKYQDVMHKNKYFDFADMILEVTSQLENNETLRTAIQERFNYILIDEFQDTNDAQFRLSYLIASNPALERRPNIMAVGDDDQAIYRFQGANLSNARQFMESYEDTKLIVLTQNYRSHQTILDTSEEVALQIEHRLINEVSNLNKHLTSERDMKKSRVEHLQFPSQTEQYCQLAAEIANQRKNGHVTTAVLARKHGSLEQMATELTRLGVPIRYERSSNILEHPAVLLLTNLTELLQAIHTGSKEQVNSLLAEVLPHPAWDISAVTLWKLAFAQKTKNISWLDLLLESKDENLKKIALWLLELSKLAQHSPLRLTIEYLLGLRQLPIYTSPIKAYFLDQKLSSDYIFTLTAIERLRSLATEYAKSEDASLGSFVRYLKINQQHNVILANEAAIITGEYPVELMTVHKAKGLEFDSVYVIDAIERHWQPNKKGRTPPSNLETLQSYGEENDDYARLLFVALTRAQKNLIITSFQFDEHGKEVLPTPYIHHIPVKKIAPSEDIVNIAETTLRWPEVKHEQRKELLRSRLEDYQLSATGLIDFLDVTKGGPAYFIQRHVLKLPELKTPSLGFGSAIHTALETLQRQINGEGLRFEQVLKSFKEALAHEYLEEGEFKRYLIHGEELLKRLVLNNLLTFNKGDYPERKITNVAIGDSFIKGVLDLVQVSKSNIHIIDYKTGSPLISLTTKSQTEGVRAWKHKTQLTYYALLAREGGIAHTSQQLSTEMIYLEAENENKMRLSFTPTTEEISHLKSIIQAVCKHLKSGEFPNTSSYPEDLTGITQFEEDLLKSHKT